MNFITKTATLSVLLMTVAETRAEPEESNPVDETAVVGPIADGTPSAPVEKPPSPDFSIVSSTVHQLGDRKMTINQVEDPNLPTSAPTLPPSSPTDPEVVERLEAMSQEYEDTELVFVSATVYDHQKTFVQWWAGGGTGPPMSCWSNVDFNHFSGFAEFTHGGRKYALLMGVGDVDTVKLAQSMERNGEQFVSPEAPSLPTGTPAFVVTEGDDVPAMAVMTGLHELYKAEGARLKSAYEGRERVRIEREQWLKEHPPKPRDITIHFWRSNHKPSGNTSQQNDGR